MQTANLTEGNICFTEFIACLSLGFIVPLSLSLFFPSFSLHLPLSVSLKYVYIYINKKKKKKIEAR